MEHSRISIAVDGRHVAWRYQRKRTKGYRLPDDVKCVTRPGRWGNPLPTALEFSIALRLFVGENYLMLASLNNEQNKRMKWIASNIHLLKGVDLACFCPVDVACHADILIRYANS